MSSSFIHVVENAKISFFTVAEIHCMYCVCTYIPHFFTHSSISGHLDWLHILTIVNNAAVNMGYRYLFELAFSFPLIKYPEVDLLDQRPQTSCHTKLQQHVLVPLPCAFTLVQDHSAGPSPPILDGDTASQTER